MPEGGPEVAVGRLGVLKGLHQSPHGRGVRRAANLIVYCYQVVRVMGYAHSPAFTGTLGSKMPTGSRRAFRGQSAGCGPSVNLQEQVIRIVPPPTPRATLEWVKHAHVGAIGHTMKDSTCVRKECSEMTVDEEKLMGYVHQAVGDFGSILSGALINIGDKLGLFKAMVAAGPVTPAELAEKTGTTERYVREWASGLAAAGYRRLRRRRPL